MRQKNSAEVASLSRLFVGQTSRHTTERFKYYSNQRSKHVRKHFNVSGKAKFQISDLETVALSNWEMVHLLTLKTFCIRQVEPERNKKKISIKAGNLQESFKICFLVPSSDIGNHVNNNFVDNYPVTFDYTFHKHNF